QGSRHPDDAELARAALGDVPAQESPATAGARREADVLKKVQDWYHEATEGLHDHYAEMAVDHDYYDNLQWSEQEKAELIARGQAPLVCNKIALAIDWLTGTERRTRVDFAIKPKEQAATEAAKHKAKLLKYQADTNNLPYARSRAFKDMVIGGLG